MKFNEDQTILVDINHNIDYILPTWMSLGKKWYL